MPKKPSHYFRPALLVPLVLVAILLGVFNTQIRRAVFRQAALTNPSPSADVVEELIARSTDHAAAIQEAWNTDSIIHRQVAVRQIGQWSDPGTNLPPALHSIALAATLDADANVREEAFGVLVRWPHPALAALIAAQLRDPDPQVRVLGLRAAKNLDRITGVPLAASVLGESDPLIVTLAVKLLETWSGERFGATLIGTAPVENPKTGLKEFSDESRTSAREAAGRAGIWWGSHQSEFPEMRLPIPSEILAGRRFVSANDFVLLSPQGEATRLSSLRGRVVLINFWTTWCTACVSEMPELVALQKAHGDQLAILGVSLDYVPDEHGHIGGHEDSGGDHAEEEHVSLAEIRKKVIRTVATRGINYTVLLDENNAVGGRFNGGELPTTVIIDADGYVRRRFVGARSLPVFEAMIAEASRPRL